MVVSDLEYITTFLGKDFSPLAPDVNQIELEDIAHALSLTCRANGHFVRFFSVAQHCINCANEAKARGLSARIQLACLLHDASEAYISDITRPVKEALPEYRTIEENLQGIIYNKYLIRPLSDHERSEVKQIDDDMLLCEFDALMEKKVFDQKPVICSSPSFECADHLASKNTFLRLAYNLMRDRKVS